ncbi:agmatine deiminase family protein [Microbacterium sp. GCS4]|uniref:agmatine deiminase family protein n=1 Tax=Microbacterium sp. GCS4 TaxID=1692239 RepID=UPI000682D2BD|nr:agmatine deiminase family protein [Microbacterium sp. GCS4]KNY05933.1 peptidyl-arginine deiminase [Microbacterium sp. GCS4]
MSAIEMTRRGLLVATGLGILGAGVLGCSPSGSAGSQSAAGATAEAATRRLGAEWERHELTVMSWPTRRIWGADTADVRADIAGIARAIAEFEPVVLLASPDDVRGARSACGSSVEVLELPVDDLWARDTVPVFVEEGGAVRGVDLNFNGWGGKQRHGDDGRVARGVLREFEIPRIATDLVGEGGSIETDGRGTLLVTESSLVNDNRNPGRSRDEVEGRLIELLGMRRVIWFDGVYGEDITDAHIDSLVRFTAPGVVLLDVPGPGAPDDVWSRSTAQARSVLGAATDADGTRFEVVDLPQPDFSEIRGSGDDFLASYVNFYVGNGAVFLPDFGDRRADDRARGILQDHFPDREMVPLAIDAVASGGGGIHCATHDLPGAPQGG